MMLLVAYSSMLFVLKHNLMKKTIHKYALILQEIWQKVFGASHVVHITTIKKRIGKLGREYHSKIYLNGCCSDRRKPGETKRTIESY